MRERSGVTGEAETREGSGTGADGSAGRGRIDLSVPQVAGSALAAVVAAKLASSFGVYGTILGAGLVSAIATCGGTVFQHFFRRTGEQWKVKRTAERPLVTADVASGPSLTGEFGEGTVYRARVRSWKRPVIAAALVFGVTMGGITAYELVSGHNLSGGASTTVGDALSGHGKSSSDSGDPDDQDDQDEPGGSGGPDGSGDATTSPSPGPDGTGSGTGPAATPSGSASGDAGTSPGDSSEQDGGTRSTTPAPTATGGQDPTAGPGGSATAPAPSASSRSQSGDQGQDGPAAP